MKCGVVFSKEKNAAKVLRNFMLWWSRSPGGLQKSSDILGVITRTKIVWKEIYTSFRGKKTQILKLCLNSIDGKKTLLNPMKLTLGVSSEH